MSGIATVPTGTLVDRALTELRGGARSSLELSQRVLGLPKAPASVAERLMVALLGADPRVRRSADDRWSMVSAATGSPLLEECAFAVVDVETTGLRAGRDDRITEIAVVIHHAGRREVVVDTLVNPGRPIPPPVSALTGITDAAVRQAPAFADLADQVMTALSGRVFVAHNARFDWGFVAAELNRARGMVLDGPMLCTVRLSKRLVRGVASCALDSMSEYFGLENPARHRAAGDAMVTAQLLDRLLPLAREQGARTLMDLELMQRKAA
ncbi:MAG: 3'-5' exonuclease [Gemmatimonadota bacterium]|nr:3'-5' exonuclease [Gemmatimonadota bacterium]